MPKITFRTKIDGALGQGSSPKILVPHTYTYSRLTSFRQLKQKCATSAPLKALDGKLLSDRACVAARWQEHFSTLLNRSTQSPLDALVSEAQASTPDSTIDTFSPMITEVYKAMNKSKAGKAPGVCHMRYLSRVHPTWWQ